jgi:hypothetical protein
VPGAPDIIEGRNTEADARNWLALIFFFFICAVLYILRVPDAFHHPQFYEEDSRIFFLQSWTDGPRAIFVPYAGYLVLFARLFAYAGRIFLPLQVPFFYACCALTVYLLAVAILLQRRVQLPHKYLLALAIVATPTSGEVFGNITNTQWFAQFGLLAILFTGAAPATRLGRNLEIGFLVIAAFSGPFAIFLAPFFLLKYVLIEPGWSARLHLKRWTGWPDYRNNAHQLILTAVMVAAAVVQGWLIITTRNVGKGVAERASFSFFDVAFFRVFSSVFFGQTLVSQVQGIAVCGAILLCVLLFVNVWPNKLLRFQLLTILCFGTLLVMSLYPQFGYRLPILGVVRNGDRYFFVPKVLLEWLVILSISGPAYLFAVLLIPLASTPYARDPMRELAWPFFARLIQQHVAVNAPFNGGNGVIWVATFPGRQLPPGTVPEGWNDAGYLQANPDIAQAVASGTFANGYDHYQKFGAQEGRSGGFAQSDLAVQ